MKIARLLPSLLLAAAFTQACDRPQDANTPDPMSAPDLAGSWRAVLTSPGGELPFGLEITAQGAGQGGGWTAHAVTGPEKLPFSSVEQNGQDVVFHFEWYDSEITARVDNAGDKLTGMWRRTGAEAKDSKLPFTAHRDDDRRFLPLAEAGLQAATAPLDSVAGHWAVEFTDEDGTEPARGEFEQDGSQVRGTFLTSTGDYRFLEGTFENGVLRLSTFDGAHAFLFSAQAADGGTLAGDFWSRDSYHATWTARRLAEGESILPNGWNEVGLTNSEGRFAYEFPDLDGNSLSSEDPRFDGKVVLVNIFGSWCPNCNDEAPLLAKWHKTYRDQGLEVVGLAYEFTGDVERDRRQVRRFAERYGLEYTMLLAGVSDKEKAAATLPDLTAVLSYPTSIFIGRDGKVRKIYSGFSGPGTGAHHERLVAEVEKLIEELLGETV